MLVSASHEAPCLRSVHLCCDSVFAVRSHNRGTWGWNLLTYRPGGTPPRWQDVQWECRYCVGCNMCPPRAHPVSPCTASAFFQSALLSPCHHRLLATESERHQVREDKQTKPQGSQALGWHSRASALSRKSEGLHFQMFKEHMLTRTGWIQSSSS